MVRASAFLLNLVWTFYAFTTKRSLCSRSDCEKRRAIWNACVAELKQDPGLKKDFDAHMLSVTETIGQYSYASFV
jgi:hypothetical protein